MRDDTLLLTDASESRTESVGVAVVIPVFRHSVLLTEAIESVLNQSADFPVWLVLVNDGCPHLETDEVCRAYAFSHPDRVIYLRKPNGGLSDARNHGIRHVLDAIPSVSAIYMMDADNRLRPMAMARALAELTLHPEADWIYPNIDMFGLPWSGDYGGDYSLLLHTQLNLCEAGSLIHRRVFEAGVFFDTTFKSGFEDWDFFLTAAEAGFRGRNLENFGFLYRKRGESMLAESERESAVIKGEMQRKHKALFTPRRLAELEQVEAPRFAIHLIDRQEVRLTLDPESGLGQTVSIATYQEMWWRARTAPSRYSVPPILLVTRSDVLERLKAARLLHSAFWLLERQLSDQCFAALDLTEAKDQRISLSIDTVEGKAGLRAEMVMIRPEILREVCDDSATLWLEGLSGAVCAVPVGVVRLSAPGLRPVAPEATGFRARLRRFLPVGSEDKLPDTAADTVDVVKQLRDSPFKAAVGRSWDWRNPDIDWRQRSHLVTRVVTGARAGYPRVGDGRVHVGFLLPLVEFGGVERVALNIAQALTRAGFVPHLFVLDSQCCQVDADWQTAFASVTFLAEQDFATWSAASELYLGTPISQWSRHGNHGNVVAMLGWLDVALNFHGGAISGVMGKLRRLGLRTGISLHLSDLTSTGRQVGNTYNGLAYEHAYDMFLPCSQNLADWCHAMGVPEEKIVPIPNAPSFALTKPRTLRDLGAPASRSNPLRVIYLGRLDTQKGMDRLAATMARCKALNLPIKWRIIGKSVVHASEIHPEIAERIEPPLTTPEALAAAFDAADVFFLPSYYEGLPLTVLEAMRQGVVPVATNVGAVSEVLRDGQNGILLSGPDIVGDAVAALDRLASDPALLQSLSRCGQLDMQGRDWDSAVSGLRKRLNQA